MNRTAMFLGMLAVGFANAQQYDGKVGINTKTPSATLNVQSLAGNTGGKNLELETSTGTKLFTVKDDGKIGVNYHTPGAVLDIRGVGQSYNDNSIALRTFRDSNLSGALDFLKARGTAASPTAIQKGDVLGSVGFIGYNGNSYANSFRIMAKVTGDVSTDPAPTYYESSLSFLKETAAATQTALMTIHHTGNVGIGTENPTEALHIVGKARIQGLATNAGATTDKVVVVDNTGVLKSVDRSTFGGGNSGASANAANDLTKAGNDIKLGGTLTEATTITQGDKTLKFINADVDTEINTNTNSFGTLRNIDDRAKVEIDGATYLNGSVYRKTTLMNASGLLPNNAYFIENNGANAVTVKLPLGQKGREVCFFSSGNGSFDFTGPNGESGMVIGQQITVAPSAGACFISNGTKWLQVTGY